MDETCIKVTCNGKVVTKLAAERIKLNYPGLTARAEACMGQTRNGDIWAAIGFNIGVGGGGDHTNPEHLFHSVDGGRKWTSRVLPTGRGRGRRLCAFTVLADDTFLVVIGGARRELAVFSSADLGATFEEHGIIRATPHEKLGEGFQSMTQIADGTVLLPISRWTGDYGAGEQENVVFRSSDGGKTWGDPFPTFDWVSEPHIIQLKSSKLLGAFRHQRPSLADDPPDIVEKWGAGVFGQPGVPKDSSTIFKHVFIGESDDDGRTWNNLRPLQTKEGRTLLVFGEAHGQLVQLPDGRVVLVHGRRYPYEEYEIRARVSSDEGKTWAPEVYHVSFGAGYPASVALEDGSIVTVTGNTPFDADARPIGKWRAEAVRWSLPNQ